MKIDELQQQIEKYIPYNEQEEKDKEIMLNYIKDFENILTRENEYAHFTASGWIVNKKRDKVLMIYHNIYHSWSWTGGHADGIADLLQVAIREGKEETNIKSVIPVSKEIFMLDILSVWGHRRKGKYVADHLHLNVTYLLEADENQAIAINADENSDVKWIPIDEIIKSSTEDRMHRVYEKAIAKMEI